MILSNYLSSKLKFTNLFNIELSPVASLFQYWYLVDCLMEIRISFHQYEVIELYQVRLVDVLEESVWQGYSDTFPQLPIDRVLHGLNQVRDRPVHIID